MYPQKIYSLGLMIIWKFICFFYFSCVKKESCEEFNPLDIREVDSEERYALAETSFCPAPGLR